jgi:Putative peptidoglycan binding domain/D-alanyl-D-alanine carboxypeptidase
LIEQRYMTGYNGTVRTKAELLAWSHWQNLDPEYQRRTLALIDASLVAGRPLGIGSIFRTYDAQRALFLSRYHVSPIGTITWEGKRWAKNSGVAAAAPPGRSYHEATTPDAKALAIDFTGDLTFLALNAARYGLVEFGKVNNEPWHGQPKELPSARSRYVAATMHPLKAFLLPGEPAPAPIKVYAPTPTLRVRRSLLDGRNATGETRRLQLACNFWGWRDAMGRTLIVDDQFGERTAQGVCAMQRALGVTIDGQYGPGTARAFQRHLDYMATLAPKG